MPHTQLCHRRRPILPPMFTATTRTQCSGLALNTSPRFLGICRGYRARHPLIHPNVLPRVSPRSPTFLLFSLSKTAATWDMLTRVASTNAPIAHEVRHIPPNCAPTAHYTDSYCCAAFARAFNLKTHMETHNPNRAKPYTCPHRSCARAFSRKHDLQRHRAAIHHDQSSASSVSPPSQVMSLPKTASTPVASTAPTPAPAIGVQRGPRGWCDGCGKSWVGDAKTCECRS